MSQFPIAYEQVHYTDHEGKKGKAFIQVTGESDRMLSGLEVGKNAVPLVPRGADERLRVIDKQAITKRVPHHVDRTYGELVKSPRPKP